MREAEDGVAGVAAKLRERPLEAEGRVVTPSTAQLGHPQPGEDEGGSLVADAERLQVHGQRARVGLLRLGMLARAQVAVAELEQGVADVRMVGRERALVDREGPAQLLDRPRELGLRQGDHAEVRVDRGEGRVIGAVGAAEDLERPRVGRLGRGCSRIARAGPRRCC